MEVGVKEISEKKLVRSTWAGHVEKNGRLKTGKESRFPESGRKWRRGGPTLRLGLD